MPEKESIPTWNPLPVRRKAWLAKGLLRVIAALFLGMLVVWTIDTCTLRSSIRARQPSQSNIHRLGLTIFLVPSFTATITTNATTSIITTTNNAAATSSSLLSSSNPPPVVEVAEHFKWLEAKLEANYTDNLLAQWLTPGGEPCRDEKTTSIQIPGIDDRLSVELAAGEIHHFVIHAYGENGTKRCLGGDYFETDISGERWKSRPPIKDHTNGTYTFSVQVHPDFAGDYNLTIVLLFRSYLGLKGSPERFVYRKELRSIPIRILDHTKNQHRQMQELRACTLLSDFKPDVWTGRWTRHGRNDSCDVDNDGRYRCLAQDYPCEAPWCTGPLGSIESNGWVYSAHCSFKLFTGDEAWDCLSGKWLFFWGDSNHVDTIRNILNFILYHPEIPAVPRRFDETYTNPRNPSQSVRITSMFNGHWNVTMNYMGMESLQNQGFREELLQYFKEDDRAPDVMIMNSGLHDGVHWSTLRAYMAGAEYAVEFWEGVLREVAERGREKPKFIYRTTVATGGYARDMAFNPNKIEAFNMVMVDKLRAKGMLDGVIDDFDMTFPWHFDNRCSDGVHYGRGPIKALWRDGVVGHQYFVDLMLAHVLFNAICADT